MPASRHKIPLVAGKYHLRDRLGQGAHGTVYRATHVDLGEDVALKLLKPEVAGDVRSQRRFLREVKLATAFVHKYAVQLRDFGREPGLGSLYFTMDLVEGLTLDRVLEQRGPLAPRVASRLARQLLEVLEEAHRAGIVHRDLKPANLILTRGFDGEAEIRVLDFGVAKAVSTVRRDALGGAPTLTLDGVLVGTLHYMSPEQAQGLDVDARADLYSVGVVLYELLAGERPVAPDPEAANPLQSFLFNLSARPPRPLRALAPHVSPELEAVVHRALAKDPGERWPSAREFRRALRRAPPGDEPSREAPTRGPHRRREVGSTETSATAPRPSRSKTSSAAQGEALAPPPSPRRRRKESRRARAQGRRSRKAKRLPEGIVPGPRKGEFLCERDGSLLVWVPPQRFLRGAHLSREGRLSGLFGDPRVRSDHPPHEVSLTRGYFIGKTPVTWKQYRLFCKKTGRTPPRRVDLRTAEVTDRHPAVNVSWEDAVAYCRWAGLRLPSEAEWELAARGSDGRPFPWGDAPASPRRLNCAEHPTFGDRSTSPVGSFPLGASPFGCLDMAGNVWEWVQDRYGDYGRRPLENPRGPRRGDERVLRGGSWRSPPSECQVTRRCALAPEKRKNVVGFRVARSG